MIFRRFLAFFLSLSLIFSSTSALAASPAGWTASAADAVMAGATATITAFKGSGANAMKALVAHKPTAVAVGKELVKGGGALALAYAMSKLLEAGVDWVLDPANNRVIVTQPENPDTAPAGKVWVTNGISPTASSTPQGSCNLAYNYYSKPTAIPEGARFVNGAWRCGSTQSAGDGFWITQRAGTATDGSGENKRYIPIDTVAAQVISNAEAGHAESQDFVKAVAVGQANAGDLDTALEAVAEPTTDTANPDAPPADPTKPFDDSGILAALKKILAALGLLSILGTISDTLSSMMDWFKGEPETKPEDTALDIDVPDIAPANTDINFGGQCPAPFVFKGAIFGNAIEIQLLDTAMFCDFLATYVKWPVYASSTLYALYLIGGRKGE